MYSMSFGLGPAPRIFIKLIRIPTPLLGKLYVRLIVFLDGILLVASSKQKLTLARETLIYLFSESRFSEKSRNISTRILSRYTTFGCGNQLNRNDTNTSTREKRENFTTVPGSTGEVVSLYKGTRLINWSSSINSNCSSASTSAVSSHLATTNFRIGKNSILQLKKKTFSAEVKTELDWWMENLRLTKRMLITSESTQLIIAFDVSLKRWEAFCQ